MELFLPLPAPSRLFCCERAAKLSGHHCDRAGNCVSWSPFPWTFPPAQRWLVQSKGLQNVSGEDKVAIGQQEGRKVDHWLEGWGEGTRVFSSLCGLNHFTEKFQMLLWLLYLEASLFKCPPASLCAVKWSMGMIDSTPCGAYSNGQLAGDQEHCEWPGWHFPHGH